MFESLTAKCDTEKRGSFKLHLNLRYVFEVGGRHAPNRDWRSRTLLMFSRSFLRQRRPRRRVAAAPSRRSEPSAGVMAARDGNQTLSPSSASSAPPSADSVCLGGTANVCRRSDVNERLRQGRLRRWRRGCRREKWKWKDRNLLIVVVVGGCGRRDRLPDDVPWRVRHLRAEGDIEGPRVDTALGRGRSEHVDSAGDLADDPVDLADDPVGVGLDESVERARLSNNTRGCVWSSGSRSVLTPAQVGREPEAVSRCPAPHSPGSSPCSISRHGMTCTHQCMHMTCHVHWLGDRPG